MRSKERDKAMYKLIIDKIINAKNGSDLKEALDLLGIHDWYDRYRYMFLLGLLQGALMQFKKELSVEELESIFYNI